MRSYFDAAWCRRYRLAGALAVLGFGLFQTPAAHADAPALIPIQGFLTDSDGVPIDGDHRVIFFLYDAETDGNVLHTDAFNNLEVNAGAFIVYLGSQDDQELDLGLFRDNGGVWLEVVVDNETITPRTRLATVPYAAYAQMCGDAETLGGRAVGTLASGRLGEVATNPATSCADLLAMRSDAADGVYWVRPSSAPGPFQVYCDMTTAGGGWTLVWSNLRGGRGKPATELPFAAAISTLPRFSGVISSSLESFNVYTGLAHWAGLSPGGKLRYAWSADYGRDIDQMATCDYSFSETATYTLALSNCAQDTGTVMAGLVDYHSGRPFTAYDADHDTHADPAVNCGQAYTQTPFWYGGCWDGSINGGGEDETYGHHNGAYWVGSATAWGVPDTGTGAGNGWLFVR